MAGTSRLAGQRARRVPAPHPGMPPAAAEAELGEAGAGPVTGGERSLGHGGSCRALQHAGSFCSFLGSKGRRWPYLPAFSAVLALTSLSPRSSAPPASFLQIGRFILIWTKTPSLKPNKQTNFFFHLILLILRI